MLIELPTGVTLEADLQSPPTTNYSRPGSQFCKLAFLLHPWSWLGGSMNDPVLHSLAGALLRWNYHVLRFNSRGVGHSTGWSSFTGASEGKDLEALVQWALINVPDVRSVVFVGYSHGSLIASLHPTLPAPIQTSHILLSYPLGVRGLITLLHTGTYAASLTALLRDPASNTLVVYGTQDDFTAEGSYATWVEKLRAEAGYGTGRLEVSKVDGANHFWAGETRRELLRVVEGWLP